MADMNYNPDGEVIGSVSRVYAYEGAGWWGYVLRCGSHNAPMENYTKVEAFEQLKLAVADYFTTDRRQP